MADPDIPTEALEAAARAARDTDLPGDCRVCDEDLNAMIRAAAPHLIAEGRRQADRCWSCDHLVSSHADEGCWYTVSRATVDTNAVCTCSVMRQDAAAGTIKPPETFEGAE